MSEFYKLKLKLAALQSWGWKKPRLSGSSWRSSSFAKTLRVLPVLECTSIHREWYWSGTFRAALEGHLNRQMRKHHESFTFGIDTCHWGPRFNQAAAWAAVSAILYTYFMSFELLFLDQTPQSVTSSHWNMRRHLGSGPFQRCLGYGSQTLKKLDISLIDSKCKG